MRVFFAAALIVFSFTQAHADSMDGGQICAARVIRAYRPVIDTPNTYDKYKHCAMSCVITLHCGTIQSWATGVGKEIKDLLGKGDPSVQDLRADMVGIKFVTRGYAKSAKECYNACHKFFPMPPEGAGI